MSENTLKNIKMQFAAINQYITSNLPTPTEQKISGKDYVAFGNDNHYFEYLYKLYEKTPTLKSIIMGTNDYVCGRGAVINVSRFQEKVNRKGDTINDLIQKISLDRLIYGGFAIEVIRNIGGDVAELNHIPFSKLRSNEDNTIFYYSDDWNKSYGRVKTIVLPKFDVDDKNAKSVFYFKDNITTTTYPLPMWSASVVSAEIEQAINEYHLNTINNGFLGSYIFNLNNGIPDDEIKTEIENSINEKFSGYQNAGRILISFNESEDKKTTIERLDAEDTGERYKTLAERSREQLFIAFRATPILFGMVVNTGFNTDEYSNSYKLFNEVVVKPMQNDIVRSFNKILGANALQITPFEIVFE